MRATFHIFYNGESCKDVGLSVISRPTIPVPEREYDTIKVEGRDGELHRDRKTYKDIEIPISFNFVSKTPDVWAQDLRKVKKWLYSGKDNRLILSDDPEYYYKVKKAVMSDTERTAKRKGKFEIVFTCESYMYRVDGQDEKEIGEYLYNPYMKSQPVYKIYGKKLLYDADVELVILRYYIRIAYDQEYISGHTYGVAAKKLTEIGKMLGGFIKSVQS